MNQIIIDETQSPSIVEVITEGPQGGIIAGSYGSFMDTTIQGLVTANSAKAIALNTTILGNNVSVVDGTKVTFAKAGVYSLTFSLQLTNSENNVINTAKVWLKYMGTDYPFSATAIDVPAYRNSKAGETVCTVNFIGEAQNDGDYIEVYWTANSTQVNISTLAGNGIYPAAPGVILTASQVA